MLTPTSIRRFIDNVFGLGLGNRHWDKATLERIKKERLEELKRQQQEEQRLKKACNIRKISFKKPY